VEESRLLLNTLATEIRTVSYLLHPPLLDEAGLNLAVRCYAEGFSARSALQVELDLDANLGRLSDELEIAIFRIIQESFTNIHRHSGKLIPPASVSLVRQTQVKVRRSR